MRKALLFLLAALLASSCTCSLSQIPPQVIYAGEGCTAVLIDYKPYVTVKGGCFGFTLTQTPAAGTVLSASKQSVTVVIKATGTNLKSSQISFNVTLLDTITPKITPVGVLADYQLEQANHIYDAGDHVVKALFDTFNRNFALPDSLGGGKLPVDSSFFKKMLVVTSMDPAGCRKRFIAYADSVQLATKY